MAEIHSFEAVAPTECFKIIQMILDPNLNKSLGFSWTADSLSQQLDSDCGWWIGEPEKPAAFVVWKDLGIEAEILALYTNPEHRGRGHMHKLLTAVFGAKRQIQTWWLEVHEHNIGALNLYQKLGFKKQGERIRYYPDGGSAVIFKLTITS